MSVLSRITAQQLLDHVHLLEFYSHNTVLAHDSPNNGVEIQFRTGLRGAEEEDALGRVN